MLCIGIVPQDWTLEDSLFKLFSKCLVCQLGYLNTYSNYRLHLLFTVRPQIILTQCPYGLPNQEDTSQGTFQVTIVGHQPASSWLHITSLGTIEHDALMPRGKSSWEHEDQSLSMQPLPWGLSCDDQGRRSEIPHTAWSALGAFVGICILIYFSPPSLPQKYIYGLSYGLLERFNVSKRFVVAKIKLIEDNVVERVALVTKAWLRLCPMTERIMLWDASQDWMTSLDVYVLIHKNKCIVLLTSKFSVRLGERIWRFPPQDVMYWNSSSRSDSRWFFLTTFALHSQTSNYPYPVPRGKRV